MKIDAQYANKVTVQDYSAKPVIDGVEIVQLPYMSDDGGNFSEIARMDGGLVQGFKTPLEVKQLSISVLTPGTVKAFHLHYTQDDLWYTLPTQRLVVNLHDVREGSASFDRHMRLVLGGGKNLLLRIPQGVAHGVANLYPTDMMLFYALSQQFDIKHPDENRLPWDIFGTDIWALTKG